MCILSIVVKHEWLKKIWLTFYGTSWLDPQIQMELSEASLSSQNSEIFTLNAAGGSSSPFQNLWRLNIPGGDPKVLEPLWLCCINYIDFLQKNILKTFLFRRAFSEVLFSVFLNCYWLYLFFVFIVFYFALLEALCDVCVHEKCHRNKVYFLTYVTIDANTHLKTKSKKISEDELFITSLLKSQATSCNFFMKWHVQNTKRNRTRTQSIDKRTRIKPITLWKTTWC